MALPTPATRDNCDAVGDDPKQALLVDLFEVIGKFNGLLTHLQGSLITSTPLGFGDGLESVANALRVKLDGATLLRSAAGVKANAGTAVGQLVVLQDVGGGVAGLPPVDGSQLTNLPDFGWAKVLGRISWVASVAITAEVGVSSVTDNGTGSITVNFDTAFANNNYFPVESHGNSTGAGPPAQAARETQFKSSETLAGSIKFEAFGINLDGARVFQDPTDFAFAIFGDQ